MARQRGKVVDRLEQERLSTTAVERIKAFILEGKLAPGSRLPGERELCERLGVSRSSLREALRVLEVMGMIEIRPRSGTYVKDPTSDIIHVPLLPWLATHRETVRQIFELRQLIEPGAAALAAQRATPEELEALQQTLVDMESCIAEDNLVGAILADAEFHHVITEATRNEYLVEFTDNIAHFLEEGRKASLRVPGQPQRALAGHREIHEAIDRGDGEAARAAMEKHLRDAWFYISRELEAETAN